jgi:hypothetical protein
MKKSFKDIDPQELELLVTRSASASQGIALGKRAVFYMFLFILSLLAFLACMWAMLFTSDGEAVAERLGMQTVANVLDNALSLLAYPFLMFTGILCAYAIQQLYR